MTGHPGGSAGGHWVITISTFCDPHWCRSILIEPELFFNNSCMIEPLAVSRLSALAHDARLRVFGLLVRAGRNGLSPGELAEHLDIGATALSFHLNRLRQAGLIQQRRAGRQLIYAADYTAMRELVDFLDAECCAGSAYDCGPECGRTAVVPERASTTKTA